MTKRGQEPTLADKVYRATYETSTLWWSEDGRERVRQLLFRARRFVLDERMSGFMADLATAAFVHKAKAKVIYLRWRKKDGRQSAPILDGRKNHFRLVEQMRLGARLPHPITWIEYNLPAYLKRSNEIAGLETSDDVPEQEGWLLLQRPDNSEVSMSLFCATPQTKEDGFSLWMFPWNYVWAVDDQPLRYPTDPDILADHPQRVAVSEIVTGLKGYRSEQVGAGISSFSSFDAADADKDGMIELLGEWGGVIRRTWALLATVNDIPVLARDVKASKGFMARKHGYKHFLDHQTIHLTVPVKKDLRVLARQVVAAARKRAHMVRAHWRDDWRHMPSKLCVHEWGPDGQSCMNCGGHRLWIKEHQRGDASLGVVMTDYELHHD